MWRRFASFDCQIVLKRRVLALQSAGLQRETGLPAGPATRAATRRFCRETGPIAFLFQVPAERSSVVFFTGRNERVA